MMTSVVSIISYPHLIWPQWKDRLFPSSWWHVPRQHVVHNASTENDPVMCSRRQQRVAELGRAWCKPHLYVHEDTPASLTSCLTSIHGSDQYIRGWDQYISGSTQYILAQLSIFVAQLSIFWLNSVYLWLNSVYSWLNSVYSWLRSVYSWIISVFIACILKPTSVRFAESQLASCHPAHWQRLFLEGSAETL